MSAPVVRGWCPGALRPMQSGDGWLVRIRPPLGALTPTQAAGLARAAEAHGNGLIDLSARANLQLRGVREDSHPALIRDLDALGLIDPDLATEAARNMVITPFREGDDLPALAAALTRALSDAPDLPGKFGFAVDTGPCPVLTGTPADIRLERAASGALLLRADGHALGRVVTSETAGRAAVDLARWFVAEGGAPQGRGRMAALVASGRVPAGADTAPAGPQPPPGPGRHREGMLVGMAFGQMTAGLLLRLAALGLELRMTPWRMLLLAGASDLPKIDGLITDPANPLRRVTACTGTPGCLQAMAETRALALRLAPDLPAGADLHVSGCAKGCAHPGPADLTVVARPDGYDLVRNGRVDDIPQHRNLTPPQIAALLKVSHAPSV